MARYLIEVAYDGLCFHGSQIQGDVPTVQLLVNKVLTTLYRTKIESLGASRTDEGVHALSNYYHFDADTPPRPDFLYKCNAILPHGVVFKKIFSVSDDFNARFEASLRSYRYRIYSAKDPFLHGRALYYPYPLNEELLHHTAEIIKSNVQFESFAKRNSQVNNFNCTIHTSFWERVGSELHYCVAANRFLRGMVRGLVATQLRVARGTTTLENFLHIIEARNCTKAFFDVAGHGLYLENVHYPSEVLKLLYAI
jgi:tRNA pseudouridine38-40 synthase